MILRQSVDKEPTNKTNGSTVAIIVGSVCGMALLIILSFLFTKSKKNIFAKWKSLKFSSSIHTNIELMPKKIKGVIVLSRIGGGNFGTLCYELT